MRLGAVCEITDIGKGDEGEYPVEPTAGTAGSAEEFSQKGNPVALPSRDLKGEGLSDI
jgi:hypothetical protein